MRITERNRIALFVWRVVWGLGPRASSTMSATERCVSMDVVVTLSVLAVCVSADDLTACAAKPIMNKRLA